MPRVWFRIKQGGFSSVEMLLAASIFGFLTTALIGAIVYGRQAPSTAGDRVRAIALAEEGNAAARNARDAAFTNVASGTYGLLMTGGVWTLWGVSDTNGIFTRQVTISNIDSNRRNVTTTVTWPGGSTSVTTRLTNWRATLAQNYGPTMIAYSKTTNIPYYRIWNGTSWGAEAAATSVAGNINYVVLKSARTRNEAILGVQTSTGAIYTQTWNGSSWSAVTQVGTGPAATRSFDIAYERNSDRAVIMFTPTSGTADFAYRTWNGTTLSAATNVTASPTTGVLNWIEVDPSPISTSNDISLILSDANSDTYGMLWNGTSWSTMGTAAVWDATIASATKKTIDVEYEQTTGRAMFMWGDSVATDQYYRIWNGTTLTAATLLDIAAEGGLAEWVQLAGRPNSNEILLAVQDAGADLNTRKWSGSAWDTATQHPEHVAQTENITSRNFDIAWETHSSNAGKAWILFCNGARVSYRQWDSATSTWTSASNVLADSDDTSFIRLRADSTSGTFFAAMYEATTSGTDDIWTTQLTGGSDVWPAKTLTWDGPTSAEPVYFRVDIATP